MSTFVFQEHTIDFTTCESNLLWGIGMGNPHMIIHVNDLTKINLNKLGNKLEFNSYFPSKTNVHFVEIKSRNLLKVLVWERGCGLD